MVFLDFRTPPPPPPLFKKKKLGQNAVGEYVKFEDRSAPERLKEMTTGNRREFSDEHYRLHYVTHPGRASGHLLDSSHN